MSNLHGSQLVLFEIVLILSLTVITGGFKIQHNDPVQKIEITNPVTLKENLPEAQNPSTELKSIKKESGNGSVSNPDRPINNDKK